MVEDCKLHSSERSSAGNEQKSTAQKGNPNKSRNNPDGKRNDPKTDWPECNKGRAPDGENYLKGLASVADQTRSIFGLAPCIRARYVPAILVAIAMSEDPSYRCPGQAPRSAAMDWKVILSVWAANSSYMRHLLPAPSGCPRKAASRPRDTPTKSAPPKRAAPTYMMAPRQVAPPCWQDR